MKEDKASSPALWFMVIMLFLVFYMLNFFERPRLETNEERYKKYLREYPISKDRSKALRLYKGSIEGHFFLFSGHFDGKFGPEDVAVFKVVLDSLFGGRVIKKELFVNKLKIEVRIDNSKKNPTIQPVFSKDWLDASAPMLLIHRENKPMNPIMQPEVLDKAVALVLRINNEQFINEPALWRI